MTKQDIIDKVKAQDFPEGSYVVFGSGPLATAGIRDTNDIDLLVSDDLYDKLAKAGWEQVQKGPNDAH